MKSKEIKIQLNIRITFECGILLWAFLFRWNMNVFNIVTACFTCSACEIFIRYVDALKYIQYVLCQKSHIIITRQI